MYYILVSESNELHASHKERIIQNENLTDQIIFLVDKEYKGMNMTEFTPMIEFVTPISKDYYAEEIELSEELYDERKLQYIVPITSKLTEEPGCIKIRLTFIREEDNAMRITSPIIVNVIPNENWE